MSVLLTLNRFAAHAVAYPDDLKPIQSHAAQRQATAEITNWPGYAVTPLRALPALAAAHGLAGIHYKDEGSRFGLGSFKALGGAYAVFRLLQRQIAAKTGRPSGQITSADLLSGRYATLVRDITVTCATDGNHGRSVAWGASLFGCSCVIYIHALVSEGRRAAIAAYGADVVRLPGNYDDSVRQAQADAERLGRFVVSDTSYAGYLDVPRDVMQGYSVMVAETLSQMAQPPTHVFVQGGVGGLAAAVLAYYWEMLGRDRPVFVVVEPDRADCLRRSAEAGHRVTVQGDLDTMMAGLACGEVSEIAWPILQHGANAFMAISDDLAMAMMRQLATPRRGDPPVVAGESAVAGLAGALAALADPAMAAKLGLNGQSRLLVFGTEGATDPELYERIVGRPAATVAQAA
ncbi:MAG: diaminopropionate ammonia-lyase [Ferrovibrio sp.]|jgi:diaminopropionate ammonia-lyase|uniref:diaminopropionate ammonia-lyase n=1 Tax=Ferrovibrio sp. TaxID=1917215 RepID=UPI00391CE1A0